MNNKCNADDHNDDDDKRKKQSVLELETSSKENEVSRMKQATGPPQQPHRKEKVKLTSEIKFKLSF